MSIEILLPALKEILFFDIFEAFMFFIIFVIYNKIRITLRKSIFHISMISILDYIIGTVITIPILMQFVVILFMSLYYVVVFKTNFKKTLITNTLIFFSVFTVEVILGITFQYIFNLKFISMLNDYIKFLAMIPLRIVELILIYIYYKKMKGGEIYYEKNNKSYSKQ